MENHPQAGVSGGTMQIVNEQGEMIGIRKYHLTDKSIRRHIFRYNPFSHPTIILRKAILDKVGYYNPDYDYAEDYELYFRIGKQAQFGNLPDVLLYYRVVTKSITTRVTRAMEKKTLAIRLKAANEYGYAMTIFDKVYWILQWLSVYLIPIRLKKRLFLVFRNYY